MEHIIDELFEVYQKKAEFPFGNPNSKTILREYELYEMMMEALPKEEKEMLREYAEACRLRNCEELKQAYIGGFKTAIKLFLESVKDN